jgi:Ras homolog gene family, member A
LVYPNTDVIVICFSVDERSSYANVSSKWILEVRHHCPRTPIILAALKTDLRNDPPGYRPASWKPISAEEGAMLSQSIGAYEYVECSAKTGEGVNDVFVTAAKIFVTAAKAVMNPEGRPPKSFRCILF